MTLATTQARLNAMGFDAGPVDGVYGPRTDMAFNAALDRLPAPPAAIPAEWLPAAIMWRVIVHWTAGRHTANETDRRHYHVLIEGDGKLVRGPSIDLNGSPVKAGYAAHTMNCNSGSIGVALCCMWGARESPFDPGEYPMTRAQWNTLAPVVSALCARYDIPVTPRTVLSHAEVQATLGIRQLGKIDIMWRPGLDRMVPAIVLGDELRAQVNFV